MNNIVRYLLCLGMPPVPPGAGPPVLTQKAVEKIETHLQDLAARLRGGEQLATAAAAIADRAGVTPGQVVLFVQAAARARQQQTASWNLSNNNSVFSGLARASGGMPSRCAAAVGTPRPATP